MTSVAKSQMKKKRSAEIKARQDNSEPASKKHTSLYAYLLFLVPIFLALTSTWELWEQDIFWQIRAGDEILSGLGIQKVDTWSFSATGSPWVNFQWLATVVIRVFYGMGHESGLVLWRAACAGVLFTMMALMLRQKSTDTTAVAAWVLLPWVFLCMAFKIEMRSDMFNFMIFALVLLLWSSQSRIIAQKKHWLALGCCLLAVNFHTGTAPFIIVLVAGLFASDSTLGKRNRVLWCAAAVLTILVNPYGYKVFKPIVDIFFYSKTNQFDNYDHDPLSFDRRSLSQFGVAAWVWAIYALCASLAFFRTYLLDRKSPEFSRWFWVVMFALGCLWTILSINRMRAIPYHVLFFLPYLSRVTQELILAPWPKTVKRVGFAGATVLLAYGFYIQETHYPLARGLSLSSAAWPLGSARFIAEARPRGNILHTWGFGGYFVWHLRDYPTFGDPREAMFWDLQSKMLEAQRNPDAMRRLCDAYQIHVAVIPTPAPQFHQEAGRFVDGVSGVFPRDDWALVHFDSISTVLVRRIPEHAELISANELLYLRPQFPGTFYLHSPKRDLHSDERFQMELSRCRSTEPKNVICRVAQAALWQRSGDVSQLKAAQVLLEDVLNEPTTQKMELFLELQTIYRKLGLNDRISDINGRIKVFLSQN